MDRFIKGRVFGPLAFLVFTAVLLGAFAFSYKNVFATSHELLIKGFAWSSNIGWISFSCTNDHDPSTAGTQGACGDPNDPNDPSKYQVKVNAITGVVSGYAWSSNIGWIHMEPTGPYPELPNNSVILRAIVTTGGQTRKQFQGWARACSVFETPDSCSGALDPNRGGWDGWIKMSGNTLRCPDPPTSNTYETCLTPDGQNIKGYAWGGEVIGWIQFDEDYGPGRQIVTPTPPIKSCEISPTNPKCEDN